MGEGVGVTRASGTARGEPPPAIRLCGDIPGQTLQPPGLFKGTWPERPMEKPILLGNGPIINRRQATGHETRIIKRPVFIPV